LAVLLFALGAAFFEVFLHDGFLAGFQFEDAAERINVLAGDGLENDAVALLDEIDARPGFDTESTPDARRHDQLAFGCNVGGIHSCFVILEKA